MRRWWWAGFCTACTAGLSPGDSDPTPEGSDGTEIVDADTHDIDGTDVDTSLGTDWDTNDATDPGTDAGTDAPWNVTSIVIAGDSWSTGSVAPTQALLTEHGWSVPVVWEGTALAGSTAEQWANNQEGKLDALDAALDSSHARLLLLYLGGNDYHRELHEGLPNWRPREAALEDVLDEIEGDLASLITHAQAGRPDLHVVIVGYDYLHFEWMELLFGLGMDASGTLEYNRGLTDLEARKLGLARTMDRVHYAHNLGITTHTLGNPVTVPFTMPLVDVQPGFFDGPSWPPAYDPFPGGARRSDLDPNVFPVESLPGPTSAYLDGVHLNDAGWAPLLDNTWDQGLERLVAEGVWAP